MATSHFTGSGQSNVPKSRHDAKEAVNKAAGNTADDDSSLNTEDLRSAEDELNQDNDDLRERLPDSV
jgi:hypothetical protein